MPRKFKKQPQSQHKSNLGALGETHAESFLRSLHYTIIARNFRVFGGEIDLVALEGNTVVFVEVKTRSSMMYGTPKDAVGAKKLFLIQRAAEYFLLTHPHLPRTFRLDGIFIMLDSSTATVRSLEHIRNMSL